MFLELLGEIGCLVLRALKGLGQLGCFGLQCGLEGGDIGLELFDGGLLGLHFLGEARGFFGLGLQLLLQLRAGLVQGLVCRLQSFQGGRRFRQLGAAVLEFSSQLGHCLFLGVYFTLQLSDVRVDLFFEFFEYGGV
ncbi:Hypothetical_protein [Hexamita inflata]|uniref:Hypothetical_protein n=1 Tax=Hexamita inflata TaxID=28002 RepID=A0AA86PJR4_9EUKA|nr:Hypothetical protein HINF_LOCUS28101 [Hexamita inflata]